MQVKEVTTEEAIIVFSHDELAFLRIAVFHSMGALKELEFLAKAGRSFRQADEMIDEFHGITEMIADNSRPK